MKYAVIKVQGHQYKVGEGQEVLVDLVDGDPVVETLLVVNEDKRIIGDPIVKTAKIVVKKLGEEKGDKISVEKYKAKSRYRKHIGFRSKKTRLLIEKIS